MQRRHPVKKGDVFFLCNKFLSHYRWSWCHCLLILFRASHCKSLLSVVLTLPMVFNRSNWNFPAWMCDRGWIVLQNFSQYHKQQKLPITINEGTARWLGFSSWTAPKILLGQGRLCAMPGLRLTSLRAGLSLPCSQYLPPSGNMEGWATRVKCKMDKNWTKRKRNGVKNWEQGRFRTEIGVRRWEKMDWVSGCRDGEEPLGTGEGGR